MKRRSLFWGILLILCILPPSLAVGEEASAREERESRSKAASQDKRKSPGGAQENSSKESGKATNPAEKKEAKQASFWGEGKLKIADFSGNGKQPEAFKTKPAGGEQAIIPDKGRGNQSLISQYRTKPDGAAPAEPEREASVNNKKSDRGEPTAAYRPGYVSTNRVSALSSQGHESKAYASPDAGPGPERWQDRQAWSSSAPDSAEPPAATRGNPALKVGEVKRTKLADNAETGKVHSPLDAWLKPERWQSGEIHPVPNLNAERFRTRVRQENADGRREDKRGQTVVVRKPDGEKIMANFFDRHSNPAVGRHYNSIHQHFGMPKYDYCYLPRSVNSYSIAYRVGYRKGFRDGLHYRPYGYGYGRPICSNFYFAFYFDNPYYFDFWYDGYYPNVYHYYGWVPRWCRPPGIVVYDLDPYPYSRQRPVYYYYQEPASRVDVAGAREVLADLEQAWELSEIDYLAAYLREGEIISIYFDNEYSYSLPAEDFYTMTLDALSTVRTLSLAFDGPIWLNPNEFFVTARHIFISPDNLRQTVYISYRLHRYGGDWYIIAAGSSPQPIAHDYQDFRYR